MFKKVIFGLSASLLILALAGCSTIQSVFAGRSSGNNSQSNQPAASEETRYALGVLKMEGTNLAVTAAQAKTLLPLYKAMLSLDSSSTTAPAEMQALDDQIKEAFTAAQVTEIEKMDLSGQNMRTIMDQAGIQFGGPNRQSTQTAGQGGSSGQSNGSSRRSQGQFFQGGPAGGGPDGGPGGGFGGPGGAGGFQGGNNGTQRTPRPFSTGTVRNRANPMVINAVIALLEKKAGT
jgi:hypothetical protein